MGLRAHVMNGQIILDEPEELPEGATLDVLVLLDEPDDDLDDDDRARLVAAISRGIDQTERGEGRPAEEVLAEMRRVK